jgi:DNA-binding MarR family transcriptional regulator
VSRKPHVPFEATLRVRDGCLCLHAQRAARALARRFDAALRPLGLTNGQFSLLMALNRPEPPAMGAVASLLAMDQATLTLAVKPLRRRGLVRVDPDPRDGRIRRLALTPPGSALLADALPVWEGTNRAVEEALAEGEAGRLRDGLRALA